MTFMYLLRRGSQRLKRFSKRRNEALGFKSIRYEFLEAQCEQCYPPQVVHATPLGDEAPRIDLNLGKSFASDVNYSLAKLELKWALENAGIPHQYENGKLSLVKSPLTAAHPVQVVVS
jgi:hypothetical protein